MGLARPSDESLSKGFREPLAIIFAIMLTASLTNTSNKLFLYVTVTALLLLLSTFLPNIKRRYACPTCHGSGKNRCQKLCNQGYFGPVVGVHTFTVQSDNFVDVSNPAEATLTIKKLDFRNEGRTGEFLQTIVVKALNEEIGRFTKKFEAEPWKEVGWKDVTVKLSNYPWLVKELGTGPSDKMFNITVDYEPLTKGDRCSGCENGFVKCNKCFHGLKLFR